MKCNVKNKFSEWIAKKAEQYTEHVEHSSENNSLGIKQNQPLKRKATPADKERKRLKRQKLKEQKKQIIEESKNNQKSAKKNSVDYLYKWYKNRDSWSFKKKRQIWLINHMYDIEMINDDDFEILLNYLEQIKGGARKRLLEQANAIIKSSDKIHSDSSAVVSEEKQQESNQHSYQRARMIIQTLV